MLRHLPIHQCKYGGTRRRPTQTTSHIQPQIVQVEHLGNSRTQCQCRVESAATKSPKTKADGNQAKARRQSGK